MFASIFCNGMQQNLSLQARWLFHTFGVHFLQTTLILSQIYVKKDKTMPAF
jgi:hypothetical protein